MTSGPEPINSDLARDLTPDGLSGERVPDDVTEDVPVESEDEPQPIEAPPDVRPGPR
jgi:hypothetical protein